MKFSVSLLDFGRSSTKGHKAENVITFPAAGPTDAGLWFYHTVNESFYGWTGATWIIFGGSSTPSPVEPPTGLKVLDEGSGFGWRLYDKDPAYFGPIGADAIDFGRSYSISNTAGATGNASMNIGDDNTNSGYAGFTHGYLLTASDTYARAYGQQGTSSAYGAVNDGYLNISGGVFSWTRGESNQALGYGDTSWGYDNVTNSTNTGTTFGINNNNLAPGSFVAGVALDAGQSPGVIVVGTANEIFAAGNVPNVGTDPVFIVGNGTHTAPLGNPWEATVRSTAFRINKNASAYFKADVTIGSFLTLTPSATPGAPTEGMVYMDSTTHKLRCYDGTIWNDLF